MLSCPCAYENEEIKANTALHHRPWHKLLRLINWKETASFLRMNVIWEFPQNLMVNSLWLPGRRSIREKDGVLNINPGFFVQARKLFAREVTNLKRDPSVFSARIILNAILSFFLGSIFWDVRETNSAVFTNLQSHFGALVTCSVLIMVATGQSALMSFPSERPVFLREYTTNHYSVASYFTSRLIIETLVTCILSICLVRIFGPMPLWCLQMGVASKANSFVPHNRLLPPTCTDWSSLYARRLSRLLS